MAEVPPSTTAVAARKAAILKDLDELTNTTFGFWQKHGMDGQDRGFHATLDDAGQSVEPHDKGLVQTSRHVYAFSTYHQRRPNQSGSPSPEEMAKSAYSFLTSSNLSNDSSSDLFNWIVKPDGKTEDNKVLYGHWFVIYALSTYADVFSNEEALKNALACFHAMEQAGWHNPAFGGYRELISNSIPVVPSDATDPRPVTFNTILHGIEALTQLLMGLMNVSSSCSSLVQERLMELLRIVCTQLITPEGSIMIEYTPTPPGSPWTPVQNSLRDYGHILEATWLVSDALDYLVTVDGISRELARSYREAIMAAAEKTLKEGGYDMVNGGLYEKGPLVPSAAAVASAGGQLAKRDKIWWVQAETSLGLWSLYAHSGGDEFYLDLLERTVKFIKEHLNDKENGEWYWGVEEKGWPRLASSLNERTKCNLWKASYHTLRMLLLLGDRIAADLAKQG